MNRKLPPLTCFFILCTCILSSQQPDSLSGPEGKIFGLFTNDEPIEITLKFDMATYFRKKPKEDYLKAGMIFHTGKNDSISHEIKLRTRGEFRNRECTFAPIELNLKKVDFGYSDLDSIGKIKLVTQCNYGSDNSDNLLEEYLVYKLFNALTDTSFRVRLIRLTFVDTGKEPDERNEGKEKRVRKPITQWAFLIEPNEILAKRLNAVQLKTNSVTQKNIYPVVMDRLAMFNYMVGNYDWSIPGQHNVKIFKPLAPAMSPYVVAIPYDFDWTGVVNPPYALPAEETGLNSVRERLFTGICRPVPVFMKQLDLLASKKDEFFEIINNFEYLKKKQKSEITTYLDTFYAEMSGNRSRIISILTNSCKKL
ncbi:MAG TPA: hypothetical protein VK155_12630 [Bacteroidales bacterium]|nr:hypothetical protein [Bacteroidales bacterium]